MLAQPTQLAEGRQGRCPPDLGQTAALPVAADMEVCGGATRTGTEQLLGTCSDASRCRDQEQL